MFEDLLSKFVIRFVAYKLAALLGLVSLVIVTVESY